MISRERVARVLAGEIPDRVPLSDSYWTTTIERWRREGLPGDVSPQAYFGTDEIVRIGGDYTMQFPEVVLEENENMRLYWDSDGALRRDLHVAEGWTSQWLDFTIKTPDDWRAHRERMAFDASRISKNILAGYRHAREAGLFVCYSGHACFHPTWMRIGMEQMLMLMLDQPDFIDMLFADHVQLIIDIYEAMVSLGMQFDAAFLSDDLGYQAAPLISPDLYRSLVYPHHKRLCDRFARDGLKTLLHSDGNVEPLIPHFIDAGFAGLHPLEAKAGLDVRELKDRYGEKLALIGNIDVRKLAGTREEIEAEIKEKVTAAMVGGGYIYHSDHSVPNDVSFGNYAFAIELVKRYGAYG
ncbi:MAG: uroporphyrinogen decarboxylase family protein [Anaerolineae bacterium]